MIHTAYVKTTLTSPHGRTSYSGSISSANWVRADVSLAFDPNDLGTYSVLSFHGVYCPVWGWVVPLWAPQTSSQTQLQQVATKLSLVSTISQGPASCSPGMAGWDRWVQWQVLDQFTPAHPIQRVMPVSDSIAIGSPNTCGASPKIGNTTTDSSGRFNDHYWLCSTGCVGGTCQSNASQTWTVDSHVLTSDVKSLVYKCNSITINGQ